MRRHTCKKDEEEGSHALFVINMDQLYLNSKLVWMEDAPDIDDLNPLAH